MPQRCSALLSHPTCWSLPASAPGRHFVPFAGLLLWEWSFRAAPVRGDNVSEPRCRGGISRNCWNSSSSLFMESFVWTSIGSCVHLILWGKSQHDFLYFLAHTVPALAVGVFWVGSCVFRFVSTAFLSGTQAHAPGLSWISLPQHHPFFSRALVPFSELNLETRWGCGRSRSCGGVAFQPLVDSWELCMCSLVSDYFSACLGCHLHTSS